MAEIIDRRYIMVQKLMSMKKTHGPMIGAAMFKHKYGQAGIDAVFNYIVSCHTPENMQTAEDAGCGPGSCIIPKEVSHAR